MIMVDILWFHGLLKTMTMSSWTPTMWHTMSIVKTPMTAVNGKRICSSNAWLILTALSRLVHHSNTICYACWFILFVDWMCRCTIVIYRQIGGLYQSTHWKHHGSSRLGITPSFTSILLKVLYMGNEEYANQLAIDYQWSQSKQYMHVSNMTRRQVMAITMILFFVLV